MTDYKKIFKDRERRLKFINALRFIPTKPYLKMVYRIKTGRKLNLDNPVNFSEKLNWLKINQIHPEYTQLVDKVAVRDHIEQVLGPDRMFPLLGVWDSFDEIDFDTLPNQFVLKCSHDSGSVKVITDKELIDKKQLRKFFTGRLKINAYNIGREYPYKNVPPRIIAEQLMSADDGTLPYDYKLHCFNGEPKLMLIVSDKKTDCHEDFFDKEFNHIIMGNTGVSSEGNIDKPECFEELWELAEKLSKGMPYVRIDLYVVDKKIYFGEYTFFADGGFWPYHPEEWERRLGDWINIDA